MKNIWTNGCFDILHTGHIELFKFAKSQGLYLFVGIDGDDRVKINKGPDRPINNQLDRKNILESIKYIDEVVIFHNDQELCEFIKLYKIDKIVIGDDYKDKNVVGGHLVKEVVFFPKKPNISSSSIICHLQKNNKKN
jgi:D-beta-D-heptose 7-phosphate kinase/D-beta-D-heptose 1-phosphate adenosyltransferase